MDQKKLRHFSLGCYIKELLSHQRFSLNLKGQLDPERKPQVKVFSLFTVALLIRRLKCAFSLLIIFRSHSELSGEFWKNNELQSALFFTTPYFFKYWTVNSRTHLGVYIGDAQTFRTAAEPAGRAIITHHHCYDKKHNNIKSQKVAKH